MATSEIIIEKALALPAQAKAIVIKDQESYATAGEFLLADKAMQKEIKGVFGPMKQKSRAAWMAVCEEEEKALAPLVEAESIVKREMARYDTEQERIRQEEQRRLEAEAKRLEEERRLFEAEQLAAEGRQAEADLVLEEPVFAPVVQMPTSVPKVAGISFREAWKAECFDLKALVKAAAADDRYLPLLQANVSVIGAQARSLKGAFKVPGIKVWSEKTTAAGGR